ncbi:hypothetical protein [Sphingomonas sp.]|uniref:hypothetical protein n=1 Tax=Sphingomonas sp. TaxID=28214 RepID=UPI0031DC118A
MPGSTPPAPARRTARPFWFGQPGRLSNLSPLAAAGLSALLILIVAVALLTHAPVEPVRERLSPATTAILDHVRHGQSFYPAALDALRENDRPLRPVLFAVPLPALSITLAALPPLVGYGLMTILAVAVAASWLRRVIPIFDRQGPRALAVILLVAGLYPLINSTMIAVPEAWAGMFIALSLAQRRPEAMPTAVALGLAAMLISQTALLYALVMLALAWQAGVRREVTAWMIAIAIALLALAAHAHALNPLVTRLDPAIDAPIDLLSPGTLIATIASASVVGYLPMGVVVPLSVLAALGWAHWRQAAARRAGATMAAFALATLVTGSAAFVAGLSPLFFLGVVLAPDAVRELIAAARERRRITVTRVVR